MKKKILSLILAVVMLAGMMTSVINVSAAEEIIKEYPLNSKPGLSTTVDWNSDWYSNSESNFNYIASENAVEPYYLTTSNSTNYRPRVAYSNQNFSESIINNTIVSYQFKLNEIIENVRYIPVGFSNSTDNLFTKTIQTVYIQNGVLYATKGNSSSSSLSTSVDTTKNTVEKICQIKTGTWYTVKIKLEFDNDATTAATYDVYVSGGGKEYVVSDCKLGVPSWNWGTTVFNLTQIKRLILGYIDGSNSDRKTTVTDNGDGTSTTTYNKLGGLYLKNLKVFNTDNISEFTKSASLDKIFSGNAANNAYNGTIETTYQGFTWVNWDNASSGTDHEGDTAVADGIDAIKITTNATRSQAFPYWRRNTANELGAGNFIIEGTFRMAEAQASYYPITIISNVQSDDCFSQIRTVWVENGAFWAKGADAPNSITSSYYDNPVNKKICDIDSTAWYTITIAVSVDGDSSTVDTYSYKIFDGTTTYSGGPYALGQPINDSKKCGYELTNIKYVGFGSCHKANDVTPIMYIEDFAAYKNSSMANPTAKSNLDGVSITFDEAINSRSLTSVSLYKTKEESTKIPAVFSLSADGKTLNVNAEGLDFSSEYTVKVPKNVVSISNKSLANVYETTFNTGNAATAAEISNATCNGNLSSGNTIIVTADCKNTSGVKAKIKLCTQIQDSNGNVLGSAYTDSVYKDGATKNFKVSMKVPEDAAKVVLYATTANGDPITSYVIE